MGCSSSKQATPGEDRPRSNRLTASQGGGQSRTQAGSSRPRDAPHRTERTMTPTIRLEFLRAVHNAFGALNYGIIGGAALAQYGNKRATSDIDVMVQHEISEVVEAQLLERGMIRTAAGKLGYIASDGRCYGLDISTDRALSQIFRGREDTEAVPAGAARLLRMELLLNSKAYSYSTRAGPNANAKRNNDATDILFILDYIRQHRLRINPRECRWAVDYDFWVDFTGTYQGTEAAFTGLGLQRDPTPNNSNRQSRRNSSGSRSSSNGIRR